MLLLIYNLEETLPYEPRVKECCEPVKNPPQPPGTGDCCYDGWKKEYKDYDTKYNHADKTVTYLTNRLTHLQTQKDMWKTWRDELDKVCDASKIICGEIEMLLHHTLRISRNTLLTKRAINLLYCMLRDFFMQVDLLKKKHDYVLNCIKCRNNPALATGKGVVGMIEDYGKKLDIVIQTRDNLIGLVVSAISVVNNLNKNLGHHGNHFGLTGELKEWKKAFNCDGKAEESDQEKRRYEPGRGDYQRPAPEGEIEDLGLEPMLRFPIRESRYYKKVEEKYRHDSADFIDLSKALVEETKYRDSLKAFRDGLTSIINDPNVDPSQRCATK